MDNNTNKFGANTFSTLTSNAVGYQTPKQFQDKNVTNNSQTDTTANLKDNFENAKEEMMAAGKDPNPITGEYTQAQIDDWNKNKSTSKVGEYDAKHNIKTDKPMTQLIEAQKDVNKDLPINSMQGTEDSLDSSITSDNEQQKKDAKAFYDNKADQDTINRLATGKKGDEYPKLDEDDDPATTAQAKDLIEEKTIAGSDGKQVPSEIASDIGIKINEDGSYTPSDVNPWKADSKFKNADLTGKLSIAATAFSVIVSALSGGNIPPINFNKITGTDEKYQAYLKTVNNWNNTVINPARAKVSETKAENESTKLMNDFDSRNPNAYKNVANLKSLLPNALEMGRAEADKMRIEAQATGDAAVIAASEKATASVITDTLKYIKEAMDNGTIDKKTAQFLAYGSAANLGKTPEYVNNEAKRMGWRQWKYAAGIADIGSVSVGQGGY